MIQTNMIAPATVEAVAPTPAPPSVAVVATVALPPTTSARIKPRST